MGFVPVTGVPYQEFVQSHGIPLWMRARWRDDLTDVIVMRPTVVYAMASDAGRIEPLGI